MRIVQIVLLSILPYGFLQTGDIFKAVESNDKKAVFKWLKTATNLDIVNEGGQSVLIKAVQFKNSSLVYRLLKKGVLVNQIDSFGKTALDYAVELHNYQAMILLAQAKACVTTAENQQLCKQALMQQYKLHHKNRILAIVFGFLAIYLLVPLVMGVWAFAIVLVAISVGHGCLALYFGAGMLVGFIMTMSAFFVWCLYKIIKLDICGIIPFISFIFFGALGLPVLIILPPIIAISIESFMFHKNKRRENELCTVDFYDKLGKNKPYELCRVGVIQSV